jgi:hypothetical protein
MHMARRVAIPLFILACAGLLAVACGDATPPGHSFPEYAAPPQTVEEAYARVTAAMTGGALHSTAVVSVVDGDVESRDQTREFWIDIDNATSRMEFKLDPGADSYDRAVAGVSIVKDGYVFVPDDEDEALRHEMTKRCPGSDDPIVAFLLDCHDYYSQYEFKPPRLDGNATFGTKDAIAIVTEGAGEIDNIVVTTYLDPKTYLPMAKVDMSTFETGGTNGSTVAFEHEFIDAEDLPEAFLDPRSIGYGPPASYEDQLDDGDANTPVYWAGDEYTTPGGEDFVLVRLPEPTLYGESANLVYETPAGEQGFVILVFADDAWTEFLRSDMGVRLTNSECVPKSRLESVDAELFTIPWPEFPVSEDPQTPEEVCDLVVAKEPELVRWGHLAVVRPADGVVVAVGDESGTDPDDTAIVESVVQDLRRRE